MRAIFRCGGFFLLTLAFVLPTLAQDLPKKADQDPKKADVDPKKADGDPKKGDRDDKKGKDEKEKFVSSPPWPAGKITEIDGNNANDFTIQITQKVAEPNADAQRQVLQQQQRMGELQVAMARARTRQELLDRQRDMQNTMVALMKAQNDLIHYKDVTKDFKLRMTDTCKFRIAYPPLDYDDKGNVKKYTPKELATLRGDSGLPGYNSDRENVRVGQTVIVYLAAPKVAVKGAPKKKADDDDLLAVPNRPEVVMVMIVQEANK